MQVLQKSWSFKINQQSQIGSVSLHFAEKKPNLGVEFSKYNFCQKRKINKLYNFDKNK